MLLGFITDGCGENVEHYDLLVHDSRARFTMQSDLTDHVCQGPLLPRPGSAATTGSSPQKPMVQTNNPHTGWSWPVPLPEALARVIDDELATVACGADGEAPAVVDPPSHEVLMNFR